MGDSMAAAIHGLRVWDQTKLDFAHFHQFISPTVLFLCPSSRTFEGPEMVVCVELASQRTMILTSSEREEAKKRKHIFAPLWT